LEGGEVPFHADAERLVLSQRFFRYTSAACNAAQS